MKKLITIAGGSASGKSTIAKNLEEFLNDSGIKTIVCSQDNYTICPLADIKPLVSISEYNFDNPYSIDTKHLFSDITKMINGENVYMPEYYFGQKQKEYKKNFSGSPEVIILEGTFVLTYEYLNQIKYKSIFIDIDEKTRLERRIKRDFIERNIKEESVIERFNKFVKNSHDNYIQPSIKNADIIISNDYKIDEIIKILNIW